MLWQSIKKCENANILRDQVFKKNDLRVSFFSTRNDAYKEWLAFKILSKWKIEALFRAGLEIARLAKFYPYKLRHINHST